MSKEDSSCSNEGFAFFSKGDMIKNLTTVLAKLIIALLKLVYFRKVFWENFRAFVSHKEGLFTDHKI